MRVLFLLTILFVSASSFSSTNVYALDTKKQSSQPATFSRKAALPKWVQTLAEPPETKIKEPIVVRLNETQAWVGTQPAFLINRAIQVNDQNSLAAIGQYAIEYFPLFQRLNLHRVAILRGGASIERLNNVNLRFLQRETAMESGMVGGATTVQLLLDDVRLGDTLWITYSVEGENPVFGNRWASTFYFDGPSFTELRRISVLHPKSRPLYWRQIGDYDKTEIKPQIEQIGDVEKIRFEGKQIEGIDNEPSIPRNYFPVRVLQFSEYANWQEVATWANGLFPKVKVPEVTKLAKTFAEKPNAIAQASAALHWVQREVRYFSVSIGENSHKPQSPAVVLKRRYGDCKDKSYLLISLLSELGIEATPVLLSADAPQTPAKMHPTHLAFDHVIVRLKVDGKYYFVDPTRTNQTAMIDKLHVAFPEATGLLVDPTTQSLTTFPKRAEGLVHYEHRERFDIANLEGDATLETREVYRGNYAEWARQRFTSLTKSELRKTMLGMYEKLYSEISLEADPIFTDFPEDDRFEVLTKFKLSKLLSHKDGMYEFDYDTQIIYDTLGIPEKLIRNYPFELPVNLFHAKYAVDIVWPKNVRQYTPPSARRLDTPFFVFNEEHSSQGNLLSFSADYAVKVREVAPKSMQAFQKNAKELVKYAKGSFRIFEEQFAKKNVESLSIGEIDAFRALGRFFLAAKDIDSSKDADSMAEILCDQFAGLPAAFDLSGQELDKFVVEIVDDSEKILKIKNGKECLGRMFFALGKYEKSLENVGTDLSEFSGSDRLREIAWARYFSGDSEGAFKSINLYFETKLKQENESISTLDIANILALYQRLGRPVPADILAKAVEESDGQWPRPIIAWQLDKISQADLLKAAEHHIPDVRDIQKSDAWFFIGQKLMSENKKLESEAAFLNVIKLGIRTSTAFLQARSELDRSKSLDKDFVEGMNAIYRKKRELALQKFKVAAERGDPSSNFELGKAYYYGRGVTKDLAQGLKYVTAAANANHGRALNFLGYMYENGEGVAKDKKRGLELYRAAAAKRDHYGLYNLAEAYQSGDLLEKNLDKAVQLYTEAAELGNPLAQLELSKMYRFGRGVAVDMSQALRWAMRSAMQEDVDAMQELGIILMLGDGIERDGKTALFWLKRATVKQDAKIYYFIGQIYEKGVDVTIDLPAAIKAYEMATMLGSSDAMATLGWMHREGKGTPVNMDKALTLLSGAAARGSKLGQVQMGYMYHYGVGVKQDYSKANDFFRKAAAQGNTYAQRMMGLSFHFGRGVEKDLVVAARWYTDAIEGDDSLSQNNLADLYENGTGVAQDIQKAIELYEKSARNAFPTAFLSLGSLYERGLGKPKNLFLAYTYYKLAARLDKTEVRNSPEVMRNLSEDQIKQADAIAAAWKEGEPLPH